MSIFLMGISYVDNCMYMYNFFFYFLLILFVVVCSFVCLFYGICIVINVFVICKCDEGWVGLICDFCVIGYYGILCIGKFLEVV